MGTFIQAIIPRKYPKNGLKLKKHFHSCKRQKWLPSQIIGVKSVKSVQIIPQTTEIWPKQLNVTLSVSEG